MKKRSELFFNALQVPIDAIMILLAAVTAFAIRDVPQIIALKPKLYVFPFEQYIKVVLIVLPLFIFIYAVEGLYNITVTRKFFKEAVKVFSATSIVLVVIIVAIFLKREWFSSRFIILSGWAFAVAYVWIGRYVIQKIQKYLLVKKGLGVHRLLLVGINGKLDRINRFIKNNPNLGYRIVGHMNSGSVRKVKLIKERDGVDEVMICDATLTEDEQEKLVDYCAINNIAYKFIPTTLQTTRFEISMFRDEPIIEIKHTPLDGWGRILKRAFDFFGAVILIAITSPIMLITVIAIWLESRSPIIYKNERIGADGKKFNVYKFRYMKLQFCTDPNTPEGKEAIEYEKKLIAERSMRKGPLYKIKNDPRKTRVGAFIERFSIDEIPQLFNVLKGEMSLVGPRPHQEREVRKYHEYHRRLLTIKPGITGMAQISGRSDIDFEDEYKMDVYYIENWSLLLDIIVCLKTVKVVLGRKR